MILPIGHQESAVRRLPWVTFSLIVACIVAFLMTDTEVVETLPDPGQLIQEAAEYWREHAYLEAEPEVRTVVAYDVLPNQRSQYLQLIESTARDGAPDDPEEWAAEQAELDRLTDLALGRALPEAAESPDNPYRRWGLTPELLSPVTLVTHIFMHGGWLHLLGNLFMLFLAGPPLEDRLGRPLFATFFVTAGVASGLFYAAATPDKMIPLVGASGAIAGLLGAFCVRFWASNIKFFYFFFIGLRVLHGTFRAPAWLMLPLWFANELFWAWLMHSMGTSDGIAYWAHVGGFLFGAGVMAALAALRVEQKYIHSAIERKVTLAEANPVIEEALDIRQQGDPERALALLDRAWRGNRTDRDVALTFWDTAVACQRPEAGAEAMMGLIRLSASDGEKNQALQHWLELTRVLPTALVDSGTLIRLAADLIQQGDSELAVRALRHSVDPNNSSVSAGLALRASDMAREIDPPTALRAARRALDFPDLHEAKRTRIEVLVDELTAGGVSEAPDVFEEEAAREAARAEAGRPIELSDSSPDSPDQETTGVPVLVPPLQAPAAVLARTAGPPRLELSAEGRLEAAPEPPLPAARGVPPPLPAAAVVPPPLPVSPVLPEAEEGMAEPDDQIASGVFEAIDDVPRFAAVKLVEANPTSLEDDCLRLRVSEGRKAKIEYAKIDAVAVAAVRGLESKPVLVIDLLLNWRALDDTPLRALRLRSTGFDPRSLVSGVADSAEAFRAFIGRILDASGAAALPDAEAARGRPFRVFEDLESYQREVLRVSC